MNTDPTRLTDAELDAHVARLRDLKKKDLTQVIADEFHERPEYQGFIYILSNTAMPGILKIGFTAGLADKRAAEIGAATGVPLSFKIERKFPVYASPREVERKIHIALDGCRVNENREFFRISVEDGVAFVQAVIEGRFDGVAHL